MKELNLQPSHLRKSELLRTENEKGCGIILIRYRLDGGVLHAT